MGNAQLTMFIADVLDVPSNKVSVPGIEEDRIKELVGDYVKNNKSRFFVPDDAVGEIVAEDVYDALKSILVDTAGCYKERELLRDKDIVVDTGWSTEVWALSEDELAKVLDWYPKWYVHAWALQQFAGYSVSQVGKMDFKMLKECFEEELEIPTFIQDRYC